MLELLIVIGHALALALRGFVLDKHTADSPWTSASCQPATREASLIIDAALSGR